MSDRAKASIFQCVDKIKVIGELPINVSTPG